MREVMCPHWFVCLSAGLQENCWLDFHEICRKHGRRMNASIFRPDLHCGADEQDPFYYFFFVVVAGWAFLPGQ